MASVHSAHDDPILPGGTEYLTDAEGHPVPWLEIEGGPGNVVFVDQVPDIDWVVAQGHGVGLDVDLPVSADGDLARALGTLARYGWTTDSGRFAVQQPTYGWHGCGARGLPDALRSRKLRYAHPRRRWHSEESFSYFDSGPGWFYTLTGRAWPNVDAIVDTHLSMQLTGVPVDPTRHRLLLEALGADDRAYFRPLDGARKAGQVLLPATDNLVVRGQLRERSRGEEWVKAVLVEAPKLLSSPDAVEDLQGLERAGQWLCRLQGWHKAGDEGVTYRLSSFDSAWTEGVHVVSLTVDWELDSDPPVKPGRANG